MELKEAIRTLNQFATDIQPSVKKIAGIMSEATVLESKITENQQEITGLETERNKLKIEINKLIEKKTKMKAASDDQESKRLAYQQSLSA